MKSTIKTIIIATIITAVIMISTAFALPAVAEDLPEDFYELDAIVVRVSIIDEDLHLVECLAEDGNVWGFFDDEAEWSIGDTLTLIMWECTEAEEDDEVIDVIWTGYLELDEMARFLRTVKW